MAKQRIGARSLSVGLLIGLAVVGVYTAIDAWIAFDGFFVKYNLAARLFLDGELPPVRRLDLSPLYLEVSVWAERWFATQSLALGAMTWLHRLAVGASAGLLFVALDRRMPGGFALAGAAIFALEPHVMIYTRVFEPEIFLVLFLLGCIVATDRGTTRGAIVGGCFAACAIATRPTFLPLFLVLAPLHYGLQGARGRVLVARSAAFVLPVLVCALLLAMRVEEITGDPSTPVMNPGTVFFEGNNPLSRGTSASYPISVASMMVVDPDRPDDAHTRYREVVREDLGRAVTVREVNAFWAGKALRYMGDEPLRALRNWTEKALRSLRDDRWHDVGVAFELERVLPMMPGLFGALVSLALVGFALQLGFWRDHLFFGVFALAQLAVMTVFYVSARQQMVLVPSLIFFALVGLLQCVRRGRSAIGWAAVVALLFSYTLIRDDVDRDRAHLDQGTHEVAALSEEIASLSPAEPLSSRPDLVARVIAGTSWLARENVPGNVDQERESLLAASARLLRAKTDRDFFDEFDLATLELGAGQLARAQPRFERLAATGRLAYRGYLEASDPEFYLGRIAGLAGRRDAAVKHLERALANTPGEPFVLAELAVLEGDARWQALLERYFSRLDAHLLLGEAYLVHDRAAAAIAELAAFVNHVPRSHRANVALAVALGRAGELERGVEVYQRSLEVSSTPVIWSEGVSELYRRWAASHPGALEVQLEAARILSFHGRFQEALALLLALDSDSERLRSAIYRLRVILAKLPAVDAR